MVELETLAQVGAPLQLLWTNPLGFEGIIFRSVAYMLHFTFFHAKMARENFIQRTHFNTTENQQILYKSTPHGIEDPVTNGSCIRISNRRSIRLLNNFYIILLLTIRAIIF